MINGPDQTWCSDITLVPFKGWFLYLMAVMDWWSRYVLVWEISNTDQGSQFTSAPYIEAIESVGKRVSMYGKGRRMDNRLVERPWKGLKYRDMYIRDYQDGLELGLGLKSWFHGYKEHRLQIQRAPTTYCIGICDARAGVPKS
jgi:putative transposase